MYTVWLRKANFLQPHSSTDAAIVARLQAALHTHHRKVNDVRVSYSDEGAFTRLAIVTDTLSLPGALPLAMGLPFALLRTSYTPGWCVAYVKQHPLGVVLDDPTVLPAWIEQLLLEVCRAQQGTVRDCLPGVGHPSRHMKMR